MLSEGNKIKSLIIASGSPEIIADSAGNSFYIAADGTNVFWVEGSKIVKFSLSAGAKETMAENLAQPLGVHAENVRG